MRRLRVRHTNVTGSSVWRDNQHGNAYCLTEKSSRTDIALPHLKALIVSSLDWLMTRTVIQAAERSPCCAQRSSLAWLGGYCAISVAGIFVGGFATDCPKTISCARSERQILS